MADNDLISKRPRREEVWLCCQYVLQIETFKDLPIEDEVPTPLEGTSYSGGADRTGCAIVLFAVGTFFFDGRSFL